jgi:hypothetical protein
MLAQAKRMEVEAQSMIQEAKRMKKEAENLYPNAFPKEIVQDTVTKPRPVGRPKKQVAVAHESQ